MNFSTTSTYILIWFTICVSLICSIIKLPLALDSFMPNYLAMVLLFWATIAPERFNVLSAWFSGLLLDLLLGTTLGVHATAFGFMVWILIAQFKNIVFYSLLQKSLVVGSINFFGHFLLFWIEHIFGVVTVDYEIFGSSLTTFLVWPILYIILNYIYLVINPNKNEKNYV